MGLTISFYLFIFYYPSVLKGNQYLHQKSLQRQLVYFNYMLEQYVLLLFKTKWARMFREYIMKGDI